MLICEPSVTRSDQQTARVASLFDDERRRIFEPIFLRPLVMQRSHSDVSCHSGVSRTLSILEGFNWWIEMEQCVYRWIRRCGKCEARGSPRKIVRWPVIGVLLPDCPGETIQSTTSAAFHLQGALTSASCLSRIRSAVEPRCTPLRPRNSPQLAPPTSSRTTLFRTGAAPSHVCLTTVGTLFPS